jgi:hypothetical protein
MKLRRGALAPLKVLLVLGAVVALAAAFTGSGGSVIPGTPHTSSPCPPTDGGRAYCLVLTTFDGVEAAGAQKVTLHLENHDNNTLTNPVVTLTWVDPDLTVTWADPKPSNCSGPVTGPITCTIANVPGLGSGAGTNPPNLSQLVTLYFDSVVTGASPAVTWTAEARVNEGPSGPPNTSVRTASGSTAFDAGGDNDALTFALPGKPVALGTLGSGNASLKYSVPTGADPYETSLTADPESTDFCFGGLDCYPLELTSSVSGATTGLLIWEFIVVDPDFTKSQARVIHRYDAIAISANADTNRFNGDFRNIDGVHLSGGGLTEQDYYVRNATATSFQASVEKTGPVVDVPGTGTITGIQAGKIRLIGDQNVEKDADCMTLAGTVNKPSIHVEKVSPTDDDLHFWVCDGGNGNVGPWG